MSDHIYGARSLLEGYLMADSISRCSKYKVLANDPSNGKVVFACS